MTREERNKILEATIDVYGTTAQKVVAMEEMAELTKEISKDIRSIGNREHIVEELTDVLIMIEELRMIYDIKDEEIELVDDFKIRRMQGRLDLYY